MTLKHIMSNIVSFSLVKHIYMIKEVYYIYSVYSHNVPWDYGTTQTKCIYMVKRSPLYIHVDTMSQGIEPNRQFHTGIGVRSNTICNGPLPPM